LPDPYPRIPYSTLCPFDLRLEDIKAFPIMAKILFHHGTGIEAIFAILGCAPANGYPTVQAAIAAALAGGGGGVSFMPHCIDDGETITVPHCRQMIVHGGLEIEGTGALFLDDDAELVLEA